MLTGLREFIREENKEPIRKTISELRVETDFDLTVTNELLYAMYVFQEAVSDVLRQHRIQPHWMFALDNILRSAGQVAITILSPELGAIIAGDQQATGHVDIPEEESTSGGSTTDSAHRISAAVPLRLDGAANRYLYTQLRELEDENKKLLQKLIDAQQLYQETLKSAIDEKQQQTELLRRSMSREGTLMTASAQQQTVIPALHVSSFHQLPVVENDHDVVDGGLVAWLESVGVDSDSIDKLSSEQFTKSQLLDAVTRDDLRQIGLKGGMFYRLWEAISTHRQQPTE
jgi:mitogen-activated protein kinase kinase kinase 5